MNQPPLDRFSEDRDKFLDTTDADLDRREEILEVKADRQREDDYEKQRDKDANE